MFTSIKDLPGKLVHKKNTSNDFLSGSEDSPWFVFIISAIAGVTIAFFRYLNKKGAQEVEKKKNILDYKNRKLELELIAEKQKMSINQPKKLNGGVQNAK